MKDSERKHNWAYDTGLGKIIMKLKKLATAVEVQLGPDMDIDHYDYRWVDDRIQMLEDKRRMLNHQEYSFANKLWRKYR